jgi:periplasmic protein TonB
MTTTMSARATRFLTIGAFGAAMPALLFNALQLMTVGDGAALPTFVAHKIEVKPKLKPAPPKIVELKPIEIPVGPPCRDCGHLTEPVRPDQRVTFDRSDRMRFDSGNTGTNDNDPQPLVRILPDYPPNGRGDGWVLVRFNISPAGTVTNAAIVDAKPRGMFDRNALRAIERWRYRPAVVDGRAVERRGLQVRLVFELEQA